MTNKPQFGIGVGMGFDTISFSDQIKAIAKAGYDATFTGWHDGCDIQAWADEIKANNLIFQSVHAPFGKVDKIWETEQEGEDQIAMLIRCLDDCAKVGVKIMVAHVIIGMDRHSPNDRGVQRFRRLVEEAEKRNVVVAFENTEGLEYLEAVMKECKDSPACGYCLDTGHELCYNYGKDTLALFGDKVVATHINDNLGMTDVNTMTWHDDAHLLPFDGIADWLNVKARLDKANYNGIYSMELTRNSKPGKDTHRIYQDWSLDTFLQEALKRARKIFG